jgi:hypothetical protein
VVKHRQLAAEYETLAQAAQRRRFANAIATSGLDASRATVVVGGESFGSLVAQLRLTAADRHQTEQLLSRAVLGAAGPPAGIPATWPG